MSLFFDDRGDILKNYPSVEFIFLTLGEKTIMKEENERGNKLYFFILLLKETPSFAIFSKT